MYYESQERKLNAMGSECCVGSTTDTARLSTRIEQAEEIFRRWGSRKVLQQGVYYAYSETYAKVINSSPAKKYKTQKETFQMRPIN